MRAIKYNPGLLSLPLEARSEESSTTVKDKDKGFWDGGTPGHGTNKESSGRPSGYPGNRKPKREGIHVDLEYPAKGGRGENAR